MNAIRCLLVLLLPTFHAAAQSTAPQNAMPTDKQSPAPSEKTPAQSAALESLHAGVEQFSNGQYERAIDDFKDAKRFDPDLLNARFYLGTAYASQYIPSDPSDQNKEKGELAVAEFRNVLALDAGNLAAMDALGSLELQMASSPFNRELFLESKSNFQKHILLKPRILNRTTGLACSIGLWLLGPMPNFEKPSTNRMPIRFLHTSANNTRPSMRRRSTKASIL